MDAMAVVLSRSKTSGIEIKWNYEHGKLILKELGVPTSVYHDVWSLDEALELNEAIIGDLQKHGT